ncbi:Response regulator prrA [Chromobacterium violaceum]|uniref:Response regulator prrA n=1 Tax=Chromobacterium violaceum TaxID=536 RepID=A0A447T7I6_CHRVL|nr:Response regulator prrA [Chromobacterium violaceum]
MLVLTELLAFSGGAANPLASLYLPPVLFAALLSPGWFAWLLAALSVAAYRLLFEWHMDWPLDGGNAAYAFNLHLSGMWISFALSALLIAGFVSWLARQLRHQGDALAQARETQLRDEQLLAVGMQAAGAAHSLSTPLNTLTLLVDELISERAGDAALSQDLQLMRAQLASCRATLSRLKHGSEPSAGPQPLFASLAERLEGWRSLRPDVRLEWRAPDGDDPRVSLDAAFWPALFNLINNAAEAGGGEVAVSAGLSGGRLRLDIVNRQGCLSEAQLARPGWRRWTRPSQPAWGWHAAQPRHAGAAGRHAEPGQPRRGRRPRPHRAAAGGEQVSDFLLIDDDEAFAMVLTRSLARRGHAVAWARDAAEALARAAERPARILLDLNLDGDSGLRLLPALRAASPDSAVVVLTGYASIATAVEATKLGAVQYLAKPAGVDEILAAFAQLSANPELPLAPQPMSLRRVTWEHLQRVLAEHDGNISATARALNMHRRTVQRMLAKKPVRS